MTWNYPYFTEVEMACRCGCGLLPTDEFMQWLVIVREEVGIPLVVASAARCAAHNKAVGGGSDSAHLLGEAADITIRGADAMHLISIALKHGVQGLGIGQKNEMRLVHLDMAKSDGVRNRPAIWSY